MFDIIYIDLKKIHKNYRYFEIIDIEKLWIFLFYGLSFL